MDNLICRACAQKESGDARSMHFQVRCIWRVEDLLCLCVGGPSHEPREAESVHCKEVIGVWHSGLK